MQMKNKRIKKRALVFIVSMLTLVCSFTLGFSSWILGEKISEIAAGTVTVDVGQVRTVDFGSSLKLRSDTVRFDCRKDDQTGNVINGNETEESLSVVLEGSVYNYSDFGEVTISISSDHQTEMSSMVSKGYIELPTFDQLTRESLYETEPKSEGSYWTSDVDTSHSQDKRSFAVLSSFKWGSFFCHMNPGEFFDSSYKNGVKIGKDYSSSEVKSILDEIKSAINGAKYKLILGAKPYQYEVSLFANGGAFEDGTQKKILNNITYNDFIVFPSVKRDGYSFDGWKYDTTSSVYKNRIKVSDIVSGDSKKLSFTAQWKQKEYSVSYDANGGSGSYSDTKVYKYGETITLPSSSVFTAPSDRKKFSGWTLKGKDGISFPAGSKVRIDENSIPGVTSLSVLTFMPIWADKVFITVKYDANGGTGTIESKEQLYSSSLTLPDYNAYSKEGQMVYGWKIKGDSSGVIYPINSEVILSNGLMVNLDTIKSITFEAQWKSNVVTIEYYDKNNNHKKSESSTYGKTYTVKNNTDVGIETPKDNSFDGWEVTIGNNVLSEKQSAGDITLLNSSFESLSEHMIINLTVTFKSCLLPTAKVLMADGTYKNAGEIVPGDIVMSLNHVTGEMEPSSIIVNDHANLEASDYNVINLYFSDESKTSVVYEHGFFDLTLNKYVYIREDNYSDYVGHYFYGINGNGDYTYKKVKLISVDIEKKFTKVYSPVAANNLNIISDNMLSIAGGIDGLFNYFEYEEGSPKYDRQKMEADIAKYGLMTYDDYKDLIPYSVYEVLPCQYMSVSIGKGLITWDIIKEYIQHWGSQLIG